MREEFWKEVNEARELNQSKLWKGVFPEASVLDMNCLCDINQYLVSVNGQNVFDGGGPMINPNGMIAEPHEGFRETRWDSSNKPKIRTS